MPLAEPGNAAAEACNACANTNAKPLSARAVPTWPCELSLATYPIKAIDASAARGQQLAEFAEPRQR
eukprot:9466780-Alexandrium_andersonii.AAC.1